VDVIPTLFWLVLWLESKWIGGIWEELVAFTGEQAMNLRVCIVHHIIFAVTAIHSVPNFLAIFYHWIKYWCLPLVFIFKIWDYFGASSRNLSEEIWCTGRCKRGSQALPSGFQQKESTGRPILYVAYMWDTRDSTLKFWEFFVM
jgi:hypothetical protein